MQLKAKDMSCLHGIFTITWSWQVFYLHPDWIVNLHKPPLTVRFQFILICLLYRVFGPMCHLFNNLLPCNVAIYFIAYLYVNTMPKFTRILGIKLFHLPVSLSGGFIFMFKPMKRLLLPFISTIFCFASLLYMWSGWSCRTVGELNPTHNYSVWQNGLCTQMSNKHSFLASF